MSRRSALPGAAELFRSTGEQQNERVPGPPSTRGTSPAGPETQPDSGQAGEGPGPAQRLLDEPTPGIPAGRGTAPADPPAAAPGVGGERGRPGAGASRSTRSGPTGRERHDEKITVYVSVEELLDLERARLSLRADHGLAVDRGRIVREALAVVLADLEAQGDASTLVQRLRSR